mgnify:FL=1
MSNNNIQTVNLADNINAARLSADTRFILHPQITVRQESKDKFILSLPTGRHLLMELSRGQIITADYAIGFGIRLPTLALVAALSEGKSFVKLTLMENV